MALNLTPPAGQSPPRKTAAGTTTGTRTRVTPPPDPRIEVRREGAEGFFQLLQFGCVLGGQLADAGAIGKYGPALVPELVNVAETVPMVAGILDWMGKTGPFARVIVLAMPFALQILVNHGVFKAEALAGAGVVHPEALEADVRATMARQAAEALRQQEEAEAELARHLHSVPDSGA